MDTALRDITDLLADRDEAGIGLHGTERMFHLLVGFKLVENLRSKPLMSKDAIRALLNKLTITGSLETLIHSSRDPAALAKRQKTAVFSVLN